MQRLSSIIDKKELDKIFKGQTLKSAISHSYVVEQLEKLNMVVAKDGFLVEGRWAINPGSDQFNLPFIDFKQVHVKPTFRMAFRTQRCIILADSYYTWKESDRKPIRVYIEGKPMLIPAIYYKTNNEEYGFTLITRNVRKSLRDYADIEPVVFTIEKALSWLDFLPVAQVIKILQTTLPVPFSNHIVTQKIFVKGFNNKILHQPENIQPMLFSDL